MQNDPDSLDLAALSDSADVSIRTVRYYIEQGLLPAPETRGPGAHYGPEHLDRLLLIRRLQREHLPLAEIRRRLESLGPDEIRALARATPFRKSARQYIRDVLSKGTAGGRTRPDRHMRMVAESPPGAEYQTQPAQSRWDHIVVAPDVELHVRRPLSREQNRQVEQLLEAARDIFQEKQP